MPTRQVRAGAVTMIEVSSDDDVSGAPLEGKPRGELSDLRRRVVLTYQHHGLRAVLLRGLTFPLRFTPLRSHVRFGFDSSRQREEAVRWYRDNGRLVTIVVRSDRDAGAVRRTTQALMVRIIVAEDVGRGLATAARSTDVVVLAPGVVLHRGWLAALQWAAAHNPRAGIVGAKLVSGDGRIVSAGIERNPRRPDALEHRYRGESADWGPANVAQPVLAVTGSCMYLTRAALDLLGDPDEDFSTGYVEFCLRAWDAGLRVLYAPAAVAEHEGSGEVSVREREGRNVRTPDGALRVVYVTKDTTVGGGHRVVFEHLNGLHARGHHAELWCLAGPPDWFDLRVPVQSFGSYEELTSALTPLDALKVATWWQTACPVWEASIIRGIPVYLVQDIETSYYRDDEPKRHAVLASYRGEFRYVTTSSWNRTQLDRLGLEPAVISPGVDLATFHPRPDIPRQAGVILAVGRSNPLKNLQLTVSAWRSLPQPRPGLQLFGGEPEVAAGTAGVHYVRAPSDAAISQLLAEATVFVQTSRHEGFCLPLLEAMAAGCPVVCTDAHGNRDFCEHEVNCLMAAPTPAAVGSAIARLLGDQELRERLSSAGVETAARYAWGPKIDRLEAFFSRLGDGDRRGPGPRRQSGAVPAEGRPW